MLFYLTLTTECNLRCRYCYGKLCDDFGAPLGPFDIDYDLPSETTYSLHSLKRFCEKDPDLAIIFYGGEPLLRINRIREIMDTIDAKRYMIQTNGLYLNKLGNQYLDRLHTILVSIDGDEALTDYYRGRHVYRRVIDNVKRLHAQGFAGEVIARMTVMKETDINEQVWYLLFNEDYAFSSVHWQLDALFWKNDYDKDQFTQWSRGQYLPQIRTLVKKWVDYMEDQGVVLRIYPLMGVTQALLTREPSKLRCGAGWSVYNIQTDGNISPCPVMAGMKDFYVGNLWANSPMSLQVIHPSAPCTRCAIRDLCGGRCLYANITKLWGDEGFSLVCERVRDLVTTLKAHLPRIKQIMSDGRIQVVDFDYTKYNSCEIIP